MSEPPPDSGSMNVKTLDRLVALLLVGIVLFGAYSWWQGTRRTVEMDGMMGPMMGSMPGMSPVWYLFGALVTASVVFGVYALARNWLVSDVPSRSATTADSVETGTASQRASSRSEADSDASEGSSHEGPSTSGGLALLPEDERRIAEPVLDSPGLTQVELRGRSGFSKAKVSQTVSELEDRGLVYRERQGRTYRVYPGELLKERRQ